MQKWKWGRGQAFLFLLNLCRKDIQRHLDSVLLCSSGHTMGTQEMLNYFGLLGYSVEERIMKQEKVCEW